MFSSWVIITYEYIFKSMRFMSHEINEINEINVSFMSHLCLEFYLYLKYTLDIIIVFCSQNLFMFVHMWLSSQLFAC